jgi:virginiamycin B lyase
MNAIGKTLGLVFLCASFAYGATDATISGTVKDPSGVPFKGAFVQAQNTKTKIYVNVLSDKQGRYLIQSLPPGEYEVRANAVGYKSDPRPGVKLGGGESSSLDFAMEKGMVRWSDLSVYQGKKLLPDGKGKQLLSAECFACHGFQSRMAATRRDADGWVQAVNYMRDVRRARLGNHIDDQAAATIISYLNDTFGVDSKLPKSPTEMPGYKETLRPFSDEAMKISYVEYDMPGPNRMPFSAAPDKNGMIWIPDFGSGNRIGKLDPKTGEIEEFVAPNKGTAGIHSAVPAPDGSVWLAEQASNKVGRWDPKTRLITEYQDTYKSGMEGLEDGGSKHTIRVDHDGRVWGTAVFNNLTVFDPKTNEFSHFPDAFSPYGVEIDKDGNPWFAEFQDEGKIGKVDVKTGKVTKWAPPTPHSWPRRIEIDSDGTIWFAEYRGGKIARFDPKTETFKEFQLPGQSPTPYAFGIDKNHNLWYSSDEMDLVGRLDPKSGQVTEFPFPHSENMMKEFFLDAQGRMWYGSPANNKVGYFVPAAVN